MGGEIIANEIGGLAQDGDINKATQLAMHGALGCGVGAVSGGDCASGAVGGEVVSSLYTSKGNTAEVMAGLNAELQDGAITAEEAVERIEEWRQQGVDIASIAAGVAAFAAGGDADIAAYTGRNAAENNNVAAWALPVLAEGAAASPVVIVVAIGGSTYVIQQINQLKPSDVVESGDNDSSFSDAEMDEVTKYTAGPGLSETQAAILNITKGAIILSKEQALAINAVLSKKNEKTEPKATGVSNDSQDSNKNSNNDDDGDSKPAAAGAAKLLEYLS